MIDGVYQGMFEQSLLLDDGARNKTGALAASLTAQALGISILILLPLIYNDRMPAMRAWISVNLPLPRLPEQTPQRVASSASSSRFTVNRHPVFQAPVRILPLATAPDAGPAVLDVPAISMTSSDSVPGATGDAALPFTGHVIAQPPAAAAKPPAKPVQVGGKVQAAWLIKKVMPVYPPLARQARISGAVRLVGVVAKDGTIQQLQVVSGHPMLVPSALDAVRQWVYRPTLLNGEAVEVIAPIDVIFTLSQ